MNKKICGFTFTMYPSSLGTFYDEYTRESMRCMKEDTGCNAVTIAFMALQETAFSEEIDYTGKHMPTDDEVVSMIKYARELGMQVYLKPMVNCKDGTWRARIDFFDVEEPCETKWSVWFKNYDEYILHYAKIAEDTGCELLLIGCELVQAERKEEYWRELIGEVRKVYSGLITYNTDKYQEDHVKWWDALDVISSSGYYPIDAWDDNLRRIEKIVKKYNKPFYFAECGAPCRTGCSYIPNDWTYVGPLNQAEQEEYYRVMFEKCDNSAFVEGFMCWAWNSNLSKNPELDDGYDVYGKPACQVIKKYYEATGNIA